MSDPDVSLIAGLVTQALRVFPDLALLTPGAGGATTIGSPIITMARTAGLSAGLPISGPGIPGGATVLSVDSATQLTLSANATATASGLLFTFTPDESAIVNIADGDLASLVQAAVAKCGLCVAVNLDSARDDSSQSIVPFYGEVDLVIDVYENTTTNLVAGGTGLRAWVVAALIVRALKELLLTGLTGDANPLYTASPGIQNVTTPENQAAGVKVLRCHFRTKAAEVGRATP